MTLVRTARFVPRFIDDGSTFVIWLKDEQETVIRRVFWDDRPAPNSVRLQPVNMTLEPYYTSPGNMEIRGRVLCVVRSY